VAFSGHILATDRGVADHAIGALVAVQLAVCGLVCLAAAAIGGELDAPRGGEVWSALVVTAVLASALGFFVQSYAQRHASPARTALILASEPAFAGLFGYALAGDRLGPVELLGAAIILAAIVAVDAVPRLRPPRPLPEG
jgi:drug/metabolite transporter (DMT)-like permease